MLIWSEAKAGKRAPETAHFYAKKAGALLRLFGEDFRLAQLDAPAVDAYVRARRDEGTSDHTIHKELTTLRAALRLALRARLWSGSLDEVLPERFGAGYRPRERALTPDELSRLLGELTAPKAAAVAFMVRYLRTHSLNAFVVYRVILAVVVLVALALGVVS